MSKQKIADYWDVHKLNHYRAVLEDLQKKRNIYCLKINEIDQAIASLNSEKDKQHEKCDFSN